MAFYGAFWAKQFWHGQFQVSTSGNTPPEPDDGLLGGGGYVPGHQKHREELQRNKLAEKQAKLNALNEELAERQRLLDAQAKEDAEQAAIEAMLQEEIRRLRIERALLMHRINEEETILVLLIMARKRFKPVFH